jgi:hypothetical protein
MKTALLALTLVCTLALAGCAGSPSQTAGSPAGDKALSPMDAIGQGVLPPGAVLRPEHSLIIGSGEQWVGRVMADISRDVDAAFRFFIDTYPAQGWTLISSVRSQTSLLVFTRQDRTATVELRGGSLLGAGSMILTVTPRNTAVTVPKRP